MIGFQKSVTTIRWRYKQKSTTLLFDASFLHFLSNDRSGSKEALIYFCGLSPQSGVWYFSRAPPRKSESDSFQHSDFRRSRNERTQYIHKFFPTNFFTRQRSCPVTLYNQPQGAAEGGERMSQSERRQRLLEVLCLRRYDTCANLAQEFHVCQRTIRYDIEALMCSYPVETVCGRFGGGVRVMEGYYYHHKPSYDNALNPKQTALLRRLRKQLAGDDRDTISSILVQFAP